MIKEKEDDEIQEDSYQSSGQMLIDTLKGILKKQKEEMKRLKKEIPELEKCIKGYEKKGLSLWKGFK